MSKTDLMTINVDGTVYIADVFFHEGFCFMENIYSGYELEWLFFKEPKWYESYISCKKRFLVQQEKIDTKPRVVTQDDIGYAYFGNVINELKYETLTINEKKKNTERFKRWMH